MKRIITPLLLALTATLCHAQHMIMAEPKYDMSVLQDPRVLAELKVENPKAFTKGLKDLTNGGVRIEISDPSNVEEQVKEQMRGHDDKIFGYLKSNLSAPQLARLQQINRQAKGLVALLWDETIKDLAINDTQVANLNDLKQILTEQKQAIMEDYKQDNGDGQISIHMDAAGANRIREASTKALAKGLKVLTPAQVEKWQKLVGEPFNFEPEKKG